MEDREVAEEGEKDLSATLSISGSGSPSSISLREAALNNPGIPESDASSSHRRALEAKLGNLKSRILQLDQEILAFKKEKGWLVNITNIASADDTFVEVWNHIVDTEKFFGAPFGSPPYSNHTRTRGLKRDRELATSSVKGSGRTVRAKLQVSPKERRVESIWQQCIVILNTVKKHKYSWPFLEPVDPVLLNLPDYLEIIDKPMDLGTITRKVESDAKRGIAREYKSPLEFRDDMRQIWKNCRIYNKPGQDVRLMGDTLSELWEKRWCYAEIEQKWQFEEEHPDPNDDLYYISSSVISGTGHRNSQAPKSEIQMSFADKRKLAHQLGTLNGKQLVGAVEILTTVKVPEDESGELLLDLEELDNEVLWKLKSYVDSVLMISRKPPKVPKKVSKTPRLLPKKQRSVDGDISEDEISNISEEFTN